VVGPHAVDEEGRLETHLRDPFKRILVPLDGSERSESALEVAQEYASQFGSEIHLVRVVNPLTYGDGMMIESAYTPRLVDTLTEAATDYLDAVSQRVTVPGGVRCSVQTGSVAVMLEGYVAANDIDLVIMSTHGRGGITRAALGSVTDRMLGGQAPVLVLRAAE
jgi:nucleotide-binding universal stress UspA family protein